MHISNFNMYYQILYRIEVKFIDYQIIEPIFKSMVYGIYSQIPITELSNPDFENNQTEYQTPTPTFEDPPPDQYFLLIFST